MDLQNFIYILFAAVWISGLIWAGVIAFKSRKGEAMRCDVCGKKIKKWTGITFYENDIVTAYFHRHCYRGSSFWKKPSKPLNVNKGRMNASKLTTIDLRKGKR